MSVIRTENLLLPVTSRQSSAVSRQSRSCSCRCRCLSGCHSRRESAVAVVSRQQSAVSSQSRPCRCRCLSCCHSRRESVVAFPVISTAAHPRPAGAPPRERASAACNAHSRRESAFTFPASSAAFHPQPKAAPPPPRGAQSARPLHAMPFLSSSPENPVYFSRLRNAAHSLIQLDRLKLSPQHRSRHNFWKRVSFSHVR